MRKYVSILAFIAAIVFSLRAFRKEHAAKPLVLPPRESFSSTASLSPSLPMAKSSPFSGISQHVAIENNDHDERSVHHRRSTPTSAETHKAAIDTVKDNDAADLADDEDGLYQIAINSWQEESLAFYRDDLGLDDDKIELIKHLDQEAGEQIREIVKQVTSQPRLISAQQQEDDIHKILAVYAQKVQAIMGGERFGQAIAFRDDFNRQVDSRFGVRMKITGF